MRFADGFTRPHDFNDHQNFEDNYHPRQADSFSSSSQKTVNNNHRHHQQEESEHQLVIS
jgi:hypothetical protein